MRSRCAVCASAVFVVLAFAAAPGAARAAGLSFGAAHLYDTGRGPVAVATGDLDGDGVRDLVTANAGGDSVSVFLGDGHGGFAARRDFATGHRPSDVAVGDFNNDGVPDLVTANGDADTVSVLLGDGHGGFAAKTDFATGPYPYGVVVGDFNGDGKQDLVTADFGGDTIGLLLGDGSGGFAARIAVAVGPKTFDVAVGDFNSDGRPDLVTVFTDVFDGSAGILLGDGLGGFGAMSVFNTGLEPTAVAVGDMNDDGRQDLVSVQRLEGAGQVGVLLGDGLGSFVPAANRRISREIFSVALGDFDGDGHLDVASTKQGVIIVLRGDGLGGLAREIGFAAGAPPADIAAADFNSDGRPDLAAAGYSSNTVAVLLNGAPAVPVCGALSPTRARVGAIVTLTGWHFGASRKSSVIKFGARPAVTYVSWSDTRIKVKIPSGTAAGTVKVTVKTAAGTSRAVNFKRL